MLLYKVRIRKPYNLSYFTVSEVLINGEWSRSGLTFLYLKTTLLTYYII